MLRDSEAVKALFEEFGLFKSPELLEKYVIASEVTVEVLDLFLSRFFGTERASIDKGSGDLRELLNGLGCACLNDTKGTDDDSSAQSDESEKEIDGLRVKVQNLERKLCAVQRQLQMQGEVSQLAVALEGRLDEIERECERRVSDVMLQVSSVSEDVAHLKKEVSERASTGDVRELSEEVLRLKEEERSLVDRILGVEKKTEETDRALSDKVEGEIKRLKEAVKRAPCHHHILYDAEKPLDGLIAHLARKCGGNVHENGVVEVSASSVWDGRKVKSAVELENNTCFASNSEPNSWICYDFKGHRLVPTSYSIRSHDGPSFLKSWVLEVSNDGKNWKVVDRRDNNFDLKAEYVTHNFAISNPPCGSFRFVRLRQTGKNHNRNDHLWLSSFEVFGTFSQ